MFEILHELCIIFKELNTFLGIAFNDIKEKIGIIEKNNKRFPDHSGFISFVHM